MQVRAKFKCENKNESLYGVQVILKPVTSGSEENKSFYNYTPSGLLDLSGLKKEIADNFVLGKEYYLDIYET